MKQAPRQHWPLMVLTALLIGCGSQTSTTQTPGTQPATGTQTPSTPSVAVSGDHTFTVDQQPGLVAQKVTLPAARLLSLSGTTYSTLSTLKPGLSTLPAWKGPILSVSELSLATDDSANLFATNREDYTGNVFTPDSNKMFMFTSAGEFVGARTTPTPTAKTAGEEDNGAATPVAISGNPAFSSVQVWRYQNPNDPDHSGLITQLYDAKMNVYTQTADQYYKVQPVLKTYFDSALPLRVNDPNGATDFRPGRNGLVFIHNNALDLEQATPSAVDVYSASYEPWHAVEVDTRLTFRPPGAYRNQVMQARFDTAPDGSVYLAVAVPFPVGCFSSCQAIVGVSKIVGGQVVWQNYWDTDQPFRLEGVSAYSTGVSLLASIVPFGADEYASDDTHILTFSAAGAALADDQIPSTALRAYFNPPRQYNTAVVNSFADLKIFDSGKFYLQSSTVLLAGQLKTGIQNVLFANNGYGYGYNNGFSSLAATEDHVYVSGSSPTTNLTGGTNTVFPDYPTNYTPGTPYFVLPLDANLNRR